MPRIIEVVIDFFTTIPTENLNESKGIIKIIDSLKDTNKFW